MKVKRPWTLWLDFDRSINQMRHSNLSELNFLWYCNWVFLSLREKKPQKTNELTLSQSVTRNVSFDSYSVQKRLQPCSFFNTYLSSFIFARNVEIEATLNKLRLKVARAESRARLKTRQPLTYGYVKSFSLNDEDWYVTVHVKQFA